MLKTFYFVYECSSTAAFWKICFHEKLKANWNGAAALRNLEFIFKFYKFAFKNSKSVKKIPSDLQKYVQYNSLKQRD